MPPAGRQITQTGYGNKGHQLETRIVTTYKILPDHERFCAFTLPMKTVLLALGKEIPPTRLMHFYKHNLPLKNAWTAISASFELVDGVTTGAAVPDVTVWAPGTMVLSDKAANALPEFAGYGELLPVETPAGQYWILNCMTEIDADERQSRNTVESDQISHVETLQFVGEDVVNAGLFKSAFDGYRNLFCAEKVKNAIRNAKLVGLTFSECLVGGFE
jgi:hypothetical protein